jgi:NAD(P)-dependent dehydrogenase (short-subunit alcohol dehydrogenase family)
MEKLSGKTALVTGSTDGVGRLVARKLGQAGARVLVHGRDAKRGARIGADIEASGGAADSIAADLSALAEVRRLADAAQATVDRLDILINNAGIGTAGPRQTSAEGFELRFAVNYLAGFLLTLLLLPLIKNSAPARIVNVSSAGQQPIDFGDVMLTRGYSGTRAYCQSKLAQIMFTFDLARELDPDSLGELPASSYLHGDDHGAAERRHAYQHGRGGSRSDSEPRRGGRARRNFRPILQRTAAGEGKSAGL